MLIRHLYQMGDELLVVVQIHAFPQFWGSCGRFSVYPVAGMAAYG
jgi:hypothetical protein